MKENWVSDLRNFLEPPPLMTVDEFTQAERYLSPEACAEPGKWRNERTPYLTEVMRKVSDPTVTEIIFMSGSQLGKTELLLNILSDAHWI